MKYIFIILICFLGVCSYGQVQKVQRSTFGTQVDSSIAPGKNLIIPVFRSFAQMSAYNILDSSGRLVFIRDSNAVFVRTNQHTWRKLAYASGGSTPGGNQYSIQLNDGSGGFAGDDLFTYNYLTGDITTNNIGQVYLIPEGRVIINSLNEPVGYSNLMLPGLTPATPKRQGTAIGINDSGEVVKLFTLPSPDTTFTGVIDVVVDTINNTICVITAGGQTCYPLNGDVTIVGDTAICFTNSQGTTCLPSRHDTLTVLGGNDSTTIDGNLLCVYPHDDPGVGTCILINNSGGVSNIVLSLDSLEYNALDSNGTFLFSFPTLIRNLFAGSGLYISDTTISGNPYTAIYNTSQISTQWNYIVSAPTPTLTDSTVSVIPDIIFYMNGVRDTITTTTDYVINSVVPGYKKYILIYITSSQAIDTLWGNTDTTSITFPTVPDGGIALTHILVQGDTITVATPVTGVPVWHQGGDTASNPTIGTKNNLPINFITNNQLRAYISSVGNWVQAPRAISADEADSYQLQFLGWGTAGVSQYMVVGLDGVGGVNSGAGYFETNGFLKFSAANGYVQWLNNPNFDGIGSFNLNSRSASAGVSIGNATRQTTGNLFRIYNTSEYDVSRNVNKIILTASNQYLQADSADVPHASAFAEWRSNNKGLLPPRLTGVQMNAISSPASGLFIYNTDSVAMCYYNGAIWVKMAIVSDSQWRDTLTNGAITHTGELYNSSGINLYDDAAGDYNRLSSGDASLNYSQGAIQIFDISSGGIVLRTGNGFNCKINTDGNSVVYSHDNSFELPDSTGVAVLRVRLNDTNYSASQKGLIDLGTIGTAPAVTDTLSAHNTRIGANTVALSKILSGSYQPSITNVANLDAVSISRCLYSRTDSTAEVSGEITFDPTTGGGTLSRARFTLPITSDLNASWQCDGVAYIGVVSSIALGGVITADTTNDQAELNFPSNFNTSQTCKFKLTYYIR
jgi:hypothetical protein